jgi:hypothetical protein
MPRGALRPSCAFIFRPLRGRGECRVPVAPAVSCAIVVIERTRVTTSTPEWLFCHRRQRIKFCLSPVGPTPLRRLDTSVGVSGPHDFAVRSNISRQHAVDRSQAFRQPALQSHRAQEAAASTATHPAFVTIMIRPSCGVGWREVVEMICPTGEAKFFCKGGWTGFSTARPSGKSA